MELIYRNDHQVRSGDAEGLHRYICESIKPVEVPYVYHYTSLDALFNGMLLEQPVNGMQICLWASSVLCVNDTQEVRIGFDFVRDHIVKIEDTNDDVDVMTEMMAGYYVTSFSLLRDSLLMWRGYAKNATGISICFDVNVLRQYAKDSLMKCIYLTPEMLDRIRSYIKDSKPVSCTFGQFALVCFVLLIGLSKSKDKEKVAGRISAFWDFLMSLKNMDYIDENEVRLFVVEENSNAKSRVREQKEVVEYVERFFPKEAIVEIMVGPNNADKEKTAFFIKRYLHRIGMSHVKVTTSGLHYRG